MKTKEIPRDQFLKEAGTRISHKVAAKIGLRGLEAKFRGNVIYFPIAGLPGCHYEIGFHKDCHEIALHFQGTPENNESRLAGFLPHVEQLSAALGYHLKPDKHEGQGRKRLRIKLPLNNCTEALLEKYTDLTAQLVVLTLPVLHSIYKDEKYIKA